MTGRSARQSAPRPAVMIPLQTPITETETPGHCEERYSRHLRLNGFGPAGQRRLEAARVLVVGVGGLGCAILPYLAGAGVGTIGICDDDRVGTSNLARQFLFTEAEVGVAKTQAAKRFISAFNHRVCVESFGAVTLDWLDGNGSNWDLIIECTDVFEAKYLVADWCAAHHKPFIWGSVVGTTFQTSVFWSAPPPPYQPVTLRQLFPQIPKAGTTPTSTETGVLGPVVGQVGTIMATEAIKVIVGMGEPLIGRTLLGDALSQRMNTLSFTEGA